jgi:hypothetical protein
VCVQVVLTVGCTFAGEKTEKEREREREREKGSKEETIESVGRKTR